MRWKLMGWKALQEGSIYIPHGFGRRSSNKRRCEGGYGGVIKSPRRISLWTSWFMRWKLMGWKALQEGAIYILHGFGIHLY